MKKDAQNIESPSVSTALEKLIRGAIARGDGWLPFDRFMAMALYAPGLGYYARSDRQFGSLPSSNKDSSPNSNGSDFITAPELSPLFGAALARQVRQALDGCDSAQVWEFGAGSGALALALLRALSDRVQRYTIVELSAALRARQRVTLAAFADKVQWVDALPELMQGVVVGNEVLDAMPVQLLHFDGLSWAEMGVTWRDEKFQWSGRATDLKPPASELAFPPDSVTEIHSQAEAFIATLGERLQRGAAFFIDYGFPEAEYYHPQRHMGTLMCHHQHQADGNPLLMVGNKDITAHINFTGIAVAAQAAGLDILGYTCQARFLMNCGVMTLLDGADIKTIANTQKLLTEHEMGELFKVIGFAKGCNVDFTTAPIGFAVGDRTHTL